MNMCLGESFSMKLLELLVENGFDGEVWNVCGPAETTIGAILHRVSVTLNHEGSIPIGCPFPNYQCMIKDDFCQDVAVNQEGELYVGGVGVFAGYLGRDDLTEKALIEIDGEMYYRTGDLVEMGENGLLQYLGRKDHQVKLRGQRIELGEIERCLLNTSITACVVMKWGEDHLVAYVQSSSVSEEELRQHCQSHLPPHMVPSVFMVLNKLPLNANGKIDRKSLPKPDFSQDPSLHLQNVMQILSPTDEIEKSIHKIWCEILQRNPISISTNIFTIGGHSLLLIQLFHRYKTYFSLPSNTLSVADLFQRPTIIGHAELIRQSLDITQNIDNDNVWYPLHLIEGSNN